MIQDKTFIITSSRMWGEAYGNDVRAMAAEISLHNKVLYVNPPEGGGAFSNSSHTEAPPGDKHIVSNPQPGLWVMSPSAAAHPANDACRKGDADDTPDDSAEQYAREVMASAAEAGINPEEAYLIVDSDFTLYTYLPGLIPARFHLLYRNDRSLPDSVLPQIDAASEQAKYIIVTCSAKAASEFREHDHSAFNIGKGVDLSAYQLGREYPRPADLADIVTPIVGCAGTISSLFLSPDVIYRMATALPGAAIVLLGKKDPLVARHPVHELPNVRFIGVKSDDELPAYISAFDVCVDPAINKHPNSRYRNAIVNYLTLGKCVVCSDLDHTLPFRDHVMVAETEQEFAEKVKRALGTRVPWSIRYQRAEFARTFSWTKCVERLYVVIEMAETDAVLKTGGAGNIKAGFN